MHGYWDRSCYKERNEFMFYLTVTVLFYAETVDMLEDLLIEFITETTHKCMEIGRTGRIQVEDIIFLVRKDPKKYSRVKELLTMNEELKKARKAFDEQKY